MENDQYQFVASSKMQLLPKIATKFNSTAPNF